MTFDELTAWISTLPDGITVAVSGAGGGLLEPDEAMRAFEASFAATGLPRDLTLVHALGLGNRSTTGTNRFAHEGMVSRVIGGHWVWSPRMLKLAQDNLIAAYSLPSGAIVHLLREIGAGRPGLITHVGLNTYVDPRQGGGRCNAAAAEPVVELIELDGREWLRYLPFKVDVGIIRGTFADASGNISGVEEPSDLDSYAIALAAKNSGGVVIAQVRERVADGALRPREVSVPGNLVDHVLVVPDQPQTYAGGYNLALAGLGQGEVDTATEAGNDVARKIVASRAAEELIEGATINFGFGMSAGVAEAVLRSGRRDRYWFTIEQGIHQGDLLTGDMFGIAANPAVILSTADQFDLYSGGGLDQTFLGMAEMDGDGNVNVSHFGGQVSGPGGFIDISQSARNVVFCGQFEAKGALLSLREDGLRVESYGRQPKLVDRVAGVTFSGANAIATGKSVTYVTERAVFRLTPEGVELIEYAPGLDLERDILARMAFRPLLREPRRMDMRHFAKGCVPATAE